MLQRMGYPAHHAPGAEDGLACLRRQTEGAAQHGEGKIDVRLQTEQIARQIDDDGRQFRRRTATLLRLQHVQQHVSARILAAINRMAEPMQRLSQHQPLVQHCFCIRC